MADLFGSLVRAAPGVLAKRQAGINTAEQESYKRKQQQDEIQREAEARAFQEMMSARQLDENIGLRRDIQSQNEQYRRDQMTMLDKDRDAQREQAKAINEGNIASRYQQFQDAERGRNERAAADRALRAAIRAGMGPRAKSAPPGVVKSVIENEGQVKVLGDALTLFDRTKGSGLGPTNALGGSYLKDLTGLSSEDEKNLRAAIADIGSLVIRDRSGAAVTAAEFPRLRPFVPSITDPPEKIRQNLMRMQAVIAEETELYKANYGEEQGYNPIVTAVGSPPRGPVSDRAKALAAKIKAGRK